MGMPTEELVRVEYHGQVWYKTVPTIRASNGRLQTNDGNIRAIATRHSPEGNSLPVEDESHDCL